MRIGRQSISLMLVKSKEIRSRRLKMIRSRRAQANSSTRNTARKNQSAKASLARTLAEKRASMADTQKKSSTSATMLEKTKVNYTDMKLAAENATKHLEKLMNTGKGALWGNEETEPKTEPERKEIMEVITDWVEDYNDMVESLNSEGGTLNAMYARQLHGFVVSHRSKLEKIGITENSNNKLVLNEDKIKGAEAEILKEVFQGDGSFADKVLERSKKIRDNAETNLNSLNNATYSSLLENYGSSGNRFNYRA